MAEQEKSFQQGFKNPGQKKQKRKWFRLLLIVVGIIVLIGGIVVWKTGNLLSKISTNGNLLGSVGHLIPGVNNQIKGVKEGRINILLLAMRGTSDPNGGSLADSSMVVSLDPKDNKISVVSIPRDLLVSDVQDPGAFSKINAIYAQGNAKGGASQAIADAEKKYSEVAGVPIGYTVVINYQAFTDVINAVGGVPVNLKQPFEENAQFNQSGVCDGTYFTVPTGKYETKTRKTKDALGKVIGTRVTAQYPLCTPTAAALECHGDFKLPAGEQTLDAETALCFARSRDNSSDFERAKRQQLILQALKAKALSIGTLTDFNKINAIINSLGKNFSTDMQGWEMKQLYTIYMDLNKNNPQEIRRVLDEDPTEGLLYGKSDPVYGDVLLPKGDNYDKIHALFANTFTAPAQANIDVIQ